MIQLSPATTHVGALVRDVTDAQLHDPTPCPAYTVGDLLDHLGGLAVAFTHAATKQPLPAGAAGPSGDAARLAPDWRQRIPAALDELARVWSELAAWTGTTQAGPVELPGEVAGLVALDEVVVHGWDLAAACGLRFQIDDDTLRHVHGFVSQFSGPGTDDDRSGLFGPEVAVAADAPLLDRIIGMTGRDPGWAARR